jgi:GTP-binding protein HflX
MFGECRLRQSSLMFERPASGERAVLVQLDFRRGRLPPSAWPSSDMLVGSAGAQAAWPSSSGKRTRPDPSHCLPARARWPRSEMTAARFTKLTSWCSIMTWRSGPAAQPGAHARMQGHRSQQPDSRHLRIARASSHEGKLQVELAQLQHLATRLVRGWTHLERQKGGIGLRGPGEKQLETDRRLIGQAGRPAQGSPQAA